MIKVIKDEKMIDFNEAYLNGISLIENECFKEPFKKEDILYDLKENPFSVVLIDIDESLVIKGYISFWITFDSSTINRVAVLKKYQGNNVAKGLIKKAIEIAKNKGVELMTLEVRKSNLIAQNLYKNQGFKEILEKNAYYSNGENAIYMMKGLI